MNTTYLLYDLYNNDRTSYLHLVYPSSQFILRTPYPPLTLGAHGFLLSLRRAEPYWWDLDNLQDPWDL